MGTFFSPHGRNLSKDEFISLYSEIYFYMNRNLTLETEMEKILDDDCLTCDNIFKILRWKINPVNVDANKRTITTRYNKIIKTENVEKMLEGKKQQVNERKNAENLFKELIGIDGIGPVYAITLLHFVSRGEWPIYDKFAHLALLAIETEKDYPFIIKDSDLEKKFRSGTKKTFDDYVEYKSLLHKYFGDKYKEDRNIDRALWTYGHLFNENNKNKERMDIAE